MFLVALIHLWTSIAGCINPGSGDVQGDTVAVTVALTYPFSSLEYIEGVLKDGENFAAINHALLGHTKGTSIGDAEVLREQYDPKEWQRVEQVLKEFEERRIEVDALRARLKDIPTLRTPREAVFRLLRRVRSMHKGKKVLFQFSGHGFNCTEEGGSPRWCAALPGKGEVKAPLAKDGGRSTGVVDITEEKQFYINEGEIYDLLKPHGAIIDACHSGAAACELRRRSQEDGVEGFYLFASSLKYQLAADTNSGGRLTTALRNLLEGGASSCVFDLDKDGALSQREAALAVFLGFQIRSNPDLFRQVTEIASTEVYRSISSQPAHEWRTSPFLPDDEENVYGTTDILQKKGQLPSQTVSGKCLVSLRSSGCKAEQTEGGPCAQFRQRTSHLATSLETLGQNPNEHAGRLLDGSQGSGTRGMGPPRKSPSMEISENTKQYTSRRLALSFLDDWLGELRKEGRVCSQNPADHEECLKAQANLGKVESFFSSLKALSEYFER